MPAKHSSLSLSFASLFLSLTLSGSIATSFYSPGAEALSPAQSSEIASAVRVNSGKWMVADTKARALTAARKYDQAAAIYQDILKQSQALGLDLQGERLALADIFEKQRKTDLAESYYKQAISGREVSEGDENPTIAFALQSYADFLSRNKRPSEATKIKQRIAFINNQVNKAPKELTALLKEAPPTTAATYSAWAKVASTKAVEIGQLYLRRDQEPRAALAFQKAIDLDGTNSDAFEGRGEIRNRLDQQSKASLDFDKAIKLNPKNAQALFNRALNLRAKNKEKAALADFNAAVAAAPGDTEILGYRAKLYQDTKQTALAIADYSHLLELAPASEYARSQRALCYMDGRKFDLALGEFSQLAAKYPDDSTYTELKKKALHSLKPQVQATAGSRTTSR